MGIIRFRSVFCLSLLICLFNFSARESNDLIALFRPRYLNFQRLVISCFKFAIWLKYHWSDVNPQYNQTTNQKVLYCDHTLSSVYRPSVRPSVIYINITFYTCDFCLEIAESILTKRTQWVLERYIVLYHFCVFGPIGENGQPCLWLAEQFSVSADCSFRSDNEYRCHSFSLADSIILFITWWII